jgi:hypothetical protein
MDRRRIGIALYNSGRYLAAHEPLEALWLEAPASERDDCLQGLIQATAAVHKSRIGNDTGAAGLAERSIEYLRACEDIPVDALAAWLEGLAADPNRARRETPPQLHIDGDAVDVYDLAGPGIVAAGEAVAETDEDPLLAATVEYAASDLEDGPETSPFVTLLSDYLTDPTPVVRQRLRDHVERRRMRDADVDGLF